MSSVCKESVSALRTHRNRETFSVTTTAVLKNERVKYCFDLWGNVFSIFYVFVNNADANHVKPKFIFFQKTLHCGCPTGGVECAEQCNYFVQNLVKVLVC